MNLKLLREYLTENPMLVESKRFKRRFLGEARGRGSNGIYLVVAGIIYALLLAIAIASRIAFSSSLILEFQTALMCFVVPSVTYAAVAGEREKRTWELLIIAPISRAQIILGKYISAAIVVSMMGLLVLPFVLICYNRSTDTPWGVFFAYCDSVAFAFAAASLCIFISARTNRTLAAQISIYSFLFFWMILIPIFASILAEVGPHANSMLWTNPFVVIPILCQGEDHIDSSIDMYRPVFQGLFYMLMIIAALWGSMRAIRSADGSSGRGSNA